MSAPPEGYGADPGARRASQARMQRAGICAHIRATEDAAWRRFAAARAVPYPAGGALPLAPDEDRQHGLDGDVAVEARAAPSLREPATHAQELALQVEDVPPLDDPPETAV